MIRNYGPQKNTLKGVRCTLLRSEYFAKRVAVMATVTVIVVILTVVVVNKETGDHSGRIGNDSS